jgi:hypothetical protein
VKYLPKKIIVFLFLFSKSFSQEKINEITIPKGMINNTNDGEMV